MATPADWPLAPSQYLARSAAQTGQTMKLYNEVLEHVSLGQLPVTVFQTSFAPAPLISRASHAFASFQSRMTDCGEIFRTTAVSSTLSPPK